MQDKAVQSRQEGQVIPLRALPSLPLISPPSGEAGRQSRAATCDSSRPGSSVSVSIFSLWFDKQGLALSFLLHIVWRERDMEKQADRPASKHAFKRRANQHTQRQEENEARQGSAGLGTAEQDMPRGQVFPLPRCVQAYA